MFLAFGSGCPVSLRQGLPGLRPACCPLTPLPRPCVFPFDFFCAIFSFVMPVCGKDLAMKHYKHLSAHERGVINHMLNEQESFKSIARALGRDPSTISKEIRRHLRFEQKGAYGSPFNDCKMRKECLIIGLCGKEKCRMDSCRNCKHGCTPHCPDYVKEVCPDLLRPPYACNGCQKRKRCTLEKRLYRPAFAQNEYEELLSELRRGPCISEKEAAALDDLISKQIMNGQSVHHVCSSIPDEIMYSEKSTSQLHQYGDPVGEEYRSFLPLYNNHE